MLDKLQEQLWSKLQAFKEDAGQLANKSGL